MTSGSEDTPQNDTPGWRLPRWLWAMSLTVLLAVQAGFGLQGIANYWQWGHNGYNGAAYLQGARNSLRWDLAFPAQYASGAHRPDPAELYTHAPLALHAHNVVSVLVFGDRELAIRVVPAFHGVLAALMLFAIVKRRWGDVHAVVATAIYILMPINQGFANMTNHDTGCIFWSLVMLYCYLEWLDCASKADSRRQWWWVVGIFGACFMATSWNWPAYYICFLMAWHWLYASHDAPHRALSHTSLGINREHGLFGLFCAFVLLNFFGFFMLAGMAVGSFDEMATSFNARSGTTTGIYSRLWSESLEPMFSAPLIALGIAWIFGLVVRHSRGETRSADLVPLAFAFAGGMHTLIFKRTALVHIYWPWQLNPFLAIAAAIVLLWFVRVALDTFDAQWAKRRQTEAPINGRRALVALVAVAVFAPFSTLYLSHTLPLIPEGRRVAGTFGFKNYDPEYLKIVFARKLKTWTDFDTGVLILRNVPHRIEFVASMDRIRGWTTRPDRLMAPKLPEVKGGWVIIGDVRKTPRKQLLRAAAKHPLKIYGLYFMVDTREKGANIEIWNLVPDEPAPLWWRFFVNPYDAPVRAVRDPSAETKMLGEVSALSAAEQSRPKRQTAPKPR